MDCEQVQQAAKMLAGELGAQHIDLNFGCPVRKVTAKGGGSAIPVHPKLLARLVKVSSDCQLLLLGPFLCVHK